MKRNITASLDIIGLVSDIELREGQKTTSLGGIELQVAIVMQFID